MSSTLTHEAVHQIKQPQLAKSNAQILFVDDEPQILATLRALFRNKYTVFTAISGAEALEIVGQEKIHAIISDQRMPKMLGHELLRKVRIISPYTMRMILTGYSDLPAIINTINEGEVFRFINKPWQTAEIRGIVDSAVEIAQLTLEIVAKPQAVKTSPQQGLNLGIIVLDEKNDTFRQVQRLCQNACAVYHVRSLDQALDLLEREEIALMITDAYCGGEDISDFIKLLKQQHPLIMTIVATETVDSETAVELINQGQIYRYLSKPIADSLMDLSIKHGMRFYNMNKNNPKLLQRYKVDEIKETRNHSLVNRVLGRLRSRFRFFGRHAPA